MNVQTVVFGNAAVEPFGKNMSLKYIQNFNIFLSLRSKSIMAACVVSPPVCR